MNIPNEQFFEHPIINPRYIKKNYPEFYEYLESHYPEVKNISEKIYLWRNHMITPPVCYTCGGSVKFININKGYSKYCSYKCSNQNTDKKELTKKTCIERYGVENPQQSAKVKSKFINYFSIPENQEKIRQERFQRTGVYYSGQLDETKNKIKKTCLERYGVESGVQLSVAKENLKKVRKQLQISKYPDIIDCGLIEGNWMYTCACNHPECTDCSFKSFNIEPQMYFDRKRDGTELCTHLLPARENQYSSLELVVIEWLKEYNIEYELHRRDLLGNGQEIDIYIPSHHIAIECNGEWYHCTKVKPNDYHINKWKAAKERGIQLISLWGVWINTKPEITKSLLLAKLNIYNNRIQARKCKVKDISSFACNKFLNDNHIQGSTRARVHLGLYYEDQLVSVMTFGKQMACSGKKGDETWILSRFCSLINYKVIGAAGKLFKYFINHYNPNTVYSFSSNDISNGGLYQTLEFKEGGVNQSYWYYDLKRDKRYHRSAFTKSHLKELGWDDGRTEEEIMYDHYFLKNIDSGQTKWIWTKKGTTK